MTKWELEKRERSRRAKIIENAKLKNKEKLEARIQGINSEYEKLFQKAMTKVLARYERKKNIMINKVAKQYGQKTTDKVRAVRKLEKVIRISDTIKTKAIEEFQKRSKLSRTNSLWQVYLVDKGTRVHRSESVAGHRWPKHNNPQLIFELDNLWPITNETNYNQLDAPGYIRQEQFIKKIWQERFDELKSIAESKEDKWVIRDKQFYQIIYETARVNNKRKQASLWRYYKKQ